MSLEGRLPPDALRALFQLQAAGEGAAPDVGAHHNIAKCARAARPCVRHAPGTADLAHARWRRLDVPGRRAARRAPTPRPGAPPPCRHKPDAELLRRVLSRACLPTTVEAQGTQDVQVFADWPHWFRRRSGGGGGDGR